MQLNGVILYFVFLFGIIFVFGNISGKIAQEKGYSYAGFFMLGIFLNIFGIIIALCIPDRNNDRIVYPNNSPADEILKYKNLYDQGIISYSEFEDKKNQLLKG